MINSQKTIVSVVIPYFNAEHTLERAVRSILNQSFKHFELLLVNNNSNDKSESIARFLAIDDRRIKLISEPEQGVSYAANTGNKAAIGKYIARMDADDVSHPERLQKQVQLLDSLPHIDVASCLVNDVAHCAKTGGMQKYVAWSNSLINPVEIVLQSFVESPVVNPTVLFKRELIDRYGGFRQGYFPEDYELWLRWLSNGVKIQKVPEILYHWYDSDTRLTRTDNRYCTEAFYQIKAVYLTQWLFNNHHPYVWVWGAGRVTRKRVAMLEEQGVYVEGYIDVNNRFLEHATCIQCNNFNWEAPCFIISFVANWGARNEISNFLKNKGKVEGVDFILVA